MNDSLRFSKHSRRLRIFVLAASLVLTACTAEDPQRFVEEGRALYENKDYSGARVQYKNALQLNPRLAEAYYGLALLDEKSKDWPAMRQNLLETVTLDPSHLAARVKLGFLLADQLDKAKEQLAVAYKLDPNDVDAMLLDATLKYREGDKSGARQTLERVLAEDDLHSGAIRLEVTLLTDEQRDDEALKVLARGIQGHPDDLDLHLLKINKLIDLKRNDEVIGEFADLVAKFPDDTALRRTQIATLMRIGNGGQLESALRDAISDHPDETSFKLALAGYVGRTNYQQLEQLLQEFVKQDPHEARFKFRLAGYYLRDGRIEEAERLFNDIMLADPSRRDGLVAKVRLAEIALERKQDALTADRLLAEVLATDTANSEALLLRAAIRLDRQQADEAISDLRIVLRDRPNSDQALALLARGSVAKGEPEVAESYWKRAIEINPGNLTAIVPLTSLLLQRGETERAERLLAESIENNPGNSALVEVLAKLRADRQDWVGAESAVNALKTTPEGELSARMLTGMLAEKREQPLEAIRIYKDVLSIRPDANGALSAIARLYGRLGKKGELIDYLQGVLEERPGNAFASNLLARAYASDKRWDDAGKVLRDSLRIEPTDPTSYVLLAAVLTRQGKTESVPKLLGDGLAAIPYNAQLMLELAAHHERSGQFAEAREVYQKTLDKHPGNEAAANNLAFLLLASSDPNRIDKARTLVERFKESANPFYLDTYGWVLFKSGNPEQAVAALKKAVAVVPDNPAFRYHLGETYLALGDNGAGKEQLEKSIALAKQRTAFDGMERAEQLLAQMNVARRGENKI